MQSMRLAIGSDEPLYPAILWERFQRLISLRMMYHPSTALRPRPHITILLFFFVTLSSHPDTPIVLT